jgi:phospholipid/cholesterol/gamma-HCH transport system substrate-binding protein
MSEKFAPPRRFRGIRKQVNMFLFTALAGFGGLVGLVAYKQGAFVQHTQIYFHAPDATGINKGMAVRLHGVPVGAVKSVELAERGVRVRLGINNDYIAQLPRGAHARLTREGYFGAASIHILPGTAATDRAPVAEGDEIRFTAQKGMADMLDEVRQQMTPAFQELRRAAAEMADPQSDFRRSVTALREVLQELPHATRELRHVLQHTDRSIVGVGQQAEHTLGVLARVGAETEKQMPLLSGKLANTLDSLDATAIQMRELLTQAPELVRGSGELVRDTQELTQAARRTWLLRDYIEPSQMRTLPVDSFESFGKR